MVSCKSLKSGHLEEVCWHSCVPGNLVYDNSPEKYYRWKLECFCDCCRGSCLWSLVQEKDCWELSKLSCAECRADKGRAHRDLPAGWCMQIIWVGQAEEAVLGQSLHTSQMVFWNIICQLSETTVVCRYRQLFEECFPFRIRLGACSSLLMCVQKGHICPGLYFCCCCCSSGDQECIEAEIWGNSITKKIIAEVLERSF